MKPDMYIARDFRLSIADDWTRNVRPHLISGKGALPIIWYPTGEISAWAIKWLYS